MTRTAALLQRVRFVRTVVLTVLTVFVCVGAPAQVPAATAQAWLFTYRVAPSAGGQPMPAAEQLMDVAVWRGIARITVRTGALRQLTGEGGTMLLRSADSALVVINAARREVLTGSMGDVGALLGGPGAGAPIEVSDVRSTTRTLGRGPALLGYATRHAVLTQRYTLRLNAPGIAREIRTEQTVSLDISRDIGRLDPAFPLFAEQFARSLGLPEPLRRQLRAAERSVPVGFPVRSSSEGTTISGADTVHTTTRALLTELRRDAVDTASFMIPPGYRVTEMSRLLGPGRRPQRRDH